MIEFDFDFEDASITLPGSVAAYGRFSGLAEARFFPNEDVYEIRSITLQPEVKGQRSLYIPLVGAHPTHFMFATLLSASILAQIKIHDPCASHALKVDPVKEHGTRNERAW